MALIVHFSNTSFSLFVTRVRLDRRVKLLVDALIDELDCSRSFLLHVGPRATRRAVSLLVRLGRASEVCQCKLHEKK